MRQPLVASLVVAIGLMAGLGSPPAWAQLFGDSGGLPLDVDADSGIEWHQPQKAYVARGNAQATRGDTTVFADVLFAYYRELSEGGTEVYRLIAEGNVRIVSPNQEIFGGRAVYDIDTKVAVITGDNLRMVTPNEVVTARDTLEYYEDRDLAVARGQAIAVQDEDKLRADILLGQFAEDETGKLVLDRIDGQGNVVVTTANDVAMSERLMYSASSKIAILTGNVRIRRGENQVIGDIAEMDMNTNINRVLSSGRRVRGFLIPTEDTRAAGNPEAGRETSQTPPASVN